MSSPWGVAQLRDALDTPPERVWPSGVIYHGARLAVLFALAFTVHLLFPVSPVPDIPLLEKGMVADRDVVARVPFPIYKSDEDLGRERAEAAASVTPILDYDASAADTLAARSRAFFADAEAALASRGGDSARARALQAVLASRGVPTSPGIVELLGDARAREVLARSLDEAAREDARAGVAGTSDLQAYAAPQLLVRRDGREQLLSRDVLHTPTWLYERAALRLPWDARPGTAELQRLLLIRFFQPTLRLNHAATERAQALAREAVSPVAGRVLLAERIIGAHEQVGDEELQRLRSYRDELTRLGKLEGGRTGQMRAFGALLFDLVTLLVFGILVRLYRPGVYQRFRHVTVVALVVLGFVVAAAIIDRVHAPMELIPIAAPALIVAALWDGRMALNMALVLAVLVSGQTPFLGLSPLFMMMTGGAAAALSVRVVRRRAQTWVFVAMISAAYLVTAITLGLLRSRPGGEILWSVIWGVLNALASSLVAMGVLPLLEVFSKITTDQTLLELADMNRPLLRRLALEAPGTYAHSVSVANLAEAAARAAGANPLLARVGTYYHDVGKIGKPQYFIENQPQGRNPHDRLKPTTSAAIVRGHVAEGLRLADEYRLPASIQAFIREHHGTQPIGFFLDQARELNPGADLNPAEFTYPGPRPHSKETAILMLADAVESAARVLQDPTADRIRALVDRIVDARLASGQLDESPLTLGELSRVKAEFVKVLSGMYHHRIDYPVRDAGENGGLAEPSSPAPASTQADNAPGIAPASAQGAHAPGIAPEPASAEASAGAQVAPATSGKVG